MATSASEADQGLLSRSSYAALCNQNECFTFRSNGHRALEACKHAFQIEEIAHDTAGAKAVVDAGHDAARVAALGTASPPSRRL